MREPVNDYELGLLYKFCEKDPGVYTILRRLVSAGVVPEPPTFDETPTQETKDDAAS
jgi:hypothetical protein